jgi:hypothetical protein
MYDGDNLLIKILDQSTSDALQSKEGVLKQFVDNLELNYPNTLRIVRMKSCCGAESFPFSSEHAAWRETAFEPYCVYESVEEPSLRWTDVSTANAVQFWRIAPAGFGIYVDIRSGSQLIIIATAEYADNEGGKDLFTQYGRYLQSQDQSDPALFSMNKLEAVRLEAGNRL